MRYYACVLCIAAFAAGSSHPSNALARTISIADLRTIADVEEPAITPDGSRVAFVTIRDDRNTLAVADTATGAQEIVTSENSPAVPRWAPDGQRLAYLAQAAGGKLQIYVWSAHSPPRALSAFPAGVADFAWSPDGGTIAAGVPDAASTDGYFFAGDNDYTLSSVPPPEHLWLVNAADGTAKRLTSGSWTIPETDAGGIFTSQFAWSPSGDRIVFSRLPNTMSGDNEYSTLWEVDVRSGVMHKLTAHRAFELSPLFSPGGDEWIYSYPRGSNYLAENTVQLVRRGKTSELTKSFDLNAGGAIWLPGGKSLLVCADEHTRVGTWVFNIDGEFRRIALGGMNVGCDSYQDSEYDSGISASASRNGAIAFVASDSRHARELYYAASVDAPPKQLTHLNEAFDELDLGKQREISWHGPDGFTEYGVLTFPPGAQMGRRYPIVVDIHGGPGEASIQDVAEAPDWPRPQLIAARGYIVFEPNYRGSDNAGNAFLLAIAGNTVRGPAADIMSGLRAVERLPEADARSVGVCGWSYGGLMTSWLITQYHTWKAAVSGAAVDDEIQEYAFSESNVQDRYYLKTSPYAPGGEQFYRRNTPMTYAAAVTTPTLIWSTSGDPVVPVSQSYEFYHALLEHRVPVRFAVFPASTHGPADESQREALTQLWLDWLDRYLKP